MGIKENIAMQARIVELQVALNAALERVEELESAPPVTITKETVEVEVIRYVDNPDHIAQIKALQSQLRGLNV